MLRLPAILTVSLVTLFASAPLYSESALELQVAAQAQCTGAQIEKMLNSGFSKDEIKQLCGGGAGGGDTSSKPSKKSDARNPLLGEWIASVPPGNKAELAEFCNLAGRFEFRERTFRQMPTEESAKADRAATEALLGKEMAQQMDAMMRDMTGAGMQERGQLRVIEYVPDGTTWIVQDPKTGELILTAEPSGASQLRMTMGGLECLLRKAK